jgi:hypothetical protein
MVCDVNAICVQVNFLIRTGSSSDRPSAQFPVMACLELRNTEARDGRGESLAGRYRFRF